MTLDAVRITPDLALFIGNNGRPSYRPFDVPPDHVEARVKHWLSTTTDRGEKYEFVERWYERFDASAFRPHLPSQQPPKVLRNTRPLSRSALAAIQLPGPPTEPIAQGLSPERLETFRNPVRGWLGALVLLAQLAVLVAFAVGLGFSMGPVMAVLGIGPGLFWAIVIGRVSEKLAVWLWPPTQSDYAAFQRYQHELNRYQQTLRDYNAHVYDIRRRHEMWWRSLSGAGFETELAKVLREIGYHVRTTGASGDGGVDLVLQRNGSVTLVQCKAHAKPVGPSAVRDLYGTLVHRGGEAAWLVSTGSFSSSARRFAAGKPIRLRSISEILTELPQAKLLYNPPTGPI